MGFPQEYFPKTKLLFWIPKFDQFRKMGVGGSGGDAVNERDYEAFFLGDVPEGNPTPHCYESAPDRLERPA